MTATTTTQADALKAHLLRRRSLSTAEAREVYGIRRLAARVCDLRREGWVIRSDWKQDPVGVRYARYTLVRAPRRSP